MSFSFCSYVAKKQLDMLRNHCNNPHINNQGEIVNSIYKEILRATEKADTAEETIVNWFEAADSLRTKYKEEGLVESVKEVNRIIEEQRSLFKLLGV